MDQASDVKLFDEDEAPRLFLKGLSIRAISKLLGRSRELIAKFVAPLMDEIGPHRGGRPHQYNINHHAFADSESDDVAYWAGFLLADGCVTPEGQVIVCLADIDVEHLHKLNRFLRSEYPISRDLQSGYCNKTSYCRLSFRSKPIVKNLGQLGIVPAKSTIAEAEERMATSPHFWRGVIDGDGYISASSSALRIEIVGSSRICAQFADYCQSVTGHKPRVHNHKTIYRVRVAETVGVKLLASLSYENHVSLSRKRDRALGHLKRLTHEPSF